MPRRLVCEELDARITAQTVELFRQESVSPCMVEDQTGNYTAAKFESGASARSLRLLGLAIAEGRLSTLSVIAAVTIISSIVTVPVMVTGFGRRAIAVPIPPFV
ncbi:MAG: hypothetical protein E6G90_02270 [Alphaproteobacteria bacterium]|jgi:hypothetical protein|nr:MAG: hypothetical protein E6G90_02270 [Alphaproteobacteria bacterium]